MQNVPALKSILLLAANPRGTVSLRLQEEEREIKERLRLAGYGKVPINSTGATRPRDIQQVMLDFKPQIVHFTGHGAGQDGLAFEDAIGQPKLINSEALANLFQLFSERVECVVLNACYSEFQARAIAKHISYVIGMSKAIGDRAAIEFSIGFYTALGAGESIEFAFKLGCNAIQLEGIPEDLTPILFRKVGLGRPYSPNHENLYRQSAGSNDLSPQVIQSSVSSTKYDTFMDQEKKTYYSKFLPAFTINFLSLLIGSSIGYVSYNLSYNFLRSGFHNLLSFRPISTVGLVVCLVVFAVLSLLSSPILIACFPVHINSLGIRAYNFWGIYHNIAWSEIRLVKLLNILGLRYLIVKSDENRSILVPIFLSRKQQFKEDVKVYAGESSLLVQALSKFF